MTEVTLSRGAEAPTAPSLWRRMASFAYEGLILFGILLIPGAIGAIMVAITGQQHSSASDLALQVVSFLIYASYFTWFWSARGQTLPMQTWHIQLVAADGRRPGAGRAFARYLASWLWVAPAGVVMMLNHWTLRDEPRDVVASAALSIIGYAALSFVLPQKQFLHDVICGTRLVAAPPKPQRKS